MQKILIIEDEELIREELETLLLNAGFSVSSVADFDHTLAQIKAQAPDLILLDINLPGQTISQSLTIFLSCWPGSTDC